MSISWYAGQLTKLHADCHQALEMTAEALKTDLIQSQTLPFAEDSEANRRRMVIPGELQESLYVDTDHLMMGRVALVTSTPYARRLYFHPEYDYYTGTNPNAGGEWYEPYFYTPKWDWLQETYARFMSRLRAT